MHSGRLRAKCFSRNRPCRKEIISTALTTGTTRRAMGAFPPFSVFFYFFQRDRHSALRDSTAARQTKRTKSLEKRGFWAASRVSIPICGRPWNDQTVLSREIPPPLPRTVNASRGKQRLYPIQETFFSRLSSILTGFFRFLLRDRHYFVHIPVIFPSISRIHFLDDHPLEFLFVSIISLLFYYP